MNKLAAAAAALVLGAAAPELAVAQGPAPAPASISSEAQVFVQGLARWAMPLQQTLAEQTGAFVQLMDGAETALGYYEGDAGRAGEAWATAWAAEQEQLWTGIGARLDAAARATPPAAPAHLEAEPSVARMVQAMESLPGLIRRDYARNRELSLDLVRQIQAVAGGDDEAAARLPSDMFDISIAMALAENELAKAAMPMSSEGHPSRHLLSASVSTNLATIAVLRAQKAQFTGDKVDEQALAAQIRQHAGSIDAAADGMDTGAKSMLSGLRHNPAYAGSQYLKTVEQAMGSYSDSASVERRLADELRKIAAGVDAPEEVDWDALQSPLEQLGTLAEQRVAIDLQRRQALQGG